MPVCHRSIDTTTPVAHVIFEEANFIILSHYEKNHHTITHFIVLHGL